VSVVSAGFQEIRPFEQRQPLETSGGESPLFRHTIGESIALADLADAILPFCTAQDLLRALHHLRC
jgi:hypothetical protein